MIKDGYREIDMNEMSKKLLEVAKENPDLEIIPATYYGVIAEDWGYWVGNIVDIKVDYYFLDDEMWYAGCEDILDQLGLRFEDTDECENMTSEEFDAYIDSKFDELEAKGDIRKAIIVFISI
jgi:hypothetical protein